MEAARAGESRKGSAAVSSEINITAVSDKIKTELDIIKQGNRE